MMSGPHFTGVDSERTWEWQGRKSVRDMNGVAEVGRGEDWEDVDRALVSSQLQVLSRYRNASRTKLWEHPKNGEDSVVHRTTTT